MPASIFMPEMTNLRGARVPGGGGPAGDRPGWVDRGSRRPWPAVDGRLHPARDREAGGARARGARRAAHPVRNRPRPSRRARARPPPPRHVLRRSCATFAVSLTDVGLPQIVLLNGHYCNSHAIEFAVAQFHDDLPPGRARLPVPVLGRARARGGRAVPLGQRRNPRERRRDVDRARHRRGALRHGPRTRLHARRCPSSAPTRSPCSTRCSSPRRARSGRCSRTAAACGGRRASRRPRRARSSSPGQRARSSTSCATWTTCTTSSSPATSDRGGLAVPHADLGDRRVFYEEYGAGDPVVLVNGLRADHSAWALQVEYLEQLLRVVVFDNPGVGRTEGPGGPYTTDLFADVVVPLLGHLEIDRAHVVGASMGGVIAQQIALRHPAVVRSLAVHCPWWTADLHTSSPDEQLADDRPERRGPGPRAPDLALRVHAALLRRAARGVRGARAAGRRERYPQSLEAFCDQAEACIAHDVLEQARRSTSPR